MGDTEVVVTGLLALLFLFALGSLGLRKATHTQRQDKKTRTAEIFVQKKEKRNEHKQMFSSYKTTLKHGSRKRELVDERKQDKMEKVDR